MNGVLDKVSYIIKRQGLGLFIIIVHFKSAGIEKFIINHMHVITCTLCRQPSYVNRSQRLNFKCSIIF